MARDIHDKVSLTLGRMELVKRLDAGPVQSARRGIRDLFVDLKCADSDDARNDYLTGLESVARRGGRFAHKA